MEEETMVCTYCGVIDSDYDDGVTLQDHNISVKHKSNSALYEHSKKNNEHTGNRHGAFVSCSATSSFENHTNCTKPQIMISAKPGESIKFKFRIKNETKKTTLRVLCIHLAHPREELFTINDHGIGPRDPFTLRPGKEVNRDVSVTFNGIELGRCEMPIIFTFKTEEVEKSFIIMRTMVVFIEDECRNHEEKPSPFINEPVFADRLVPLSTTKRRKPSEFPVSKELKNLFAHELKLRDSYTPEERKLCEITISIFDEGVRVDNYKQYFHHLLWYEEVSVRRNMKMYNMTGRQLRKVGQMFELEVPGLAEKRPSLLKGDYVLLALHKCRDAIFTAKINNIGDNCVLIAGLNHEFIDEYKEDNTYDVHFLLSRVPFVRNHKAVHESVDKAIGQVFPIPNTDMPTVNQIFQFFNPKIAGNEEQRFAVEHIVAGTSGAAPYMVFGPPGTGKTITIVEAILQLVKKDPSNRILVCTDSNMAADHIAVGIVEYLQGDGDYKLSIIKRVNSVYRPWDVMPDKLSPYSNGSCESSFVRMNNQVLSQYAIVVSTLSHSALYGSPAEQRRHPLKMSHIFIDEAAQASEPCSLIPIVGLLRPGGQLVLAGDPQQLGPVCLSKHASRLGLGVSLMERLYKTNKELYGLENINHNYITMLRNNFRSNPDILQISNELFYENNLRIYAPADDLSCKEILPGQTEPSRAVIFHAVMSTEEREGKSPSYFNTKEIEMVKKYVKALIDIHGVKQKDIGIVTPYIRQMYKIRQWLTKQNYHYIEAGTVESFQGKEKRVIIISTVRANSSLLIHDAKFKLGFLVDDKRFNVAITRAKAKVIIIGNPACLRRDKKWRMYMDLCKQLHTYYGCDQVERDAPKLQTLAVTRYKYLPSEVEYSGKNLIEELKNVEISDD